MEDVVCNRQAEGLFNASRRPWSIERTPIQPNISMVRFINSSRRKGIETAFLKPPTSFADDSSLEYQSV